jgi:ribosomal protein S18 acetylase RimI-like enzyme
VPEIAVRSATAEDDEAIWSILEPVIRAGETYTLPRALDRQSALAWWLMGTHKVFVAEIAGQVVGTYFICANQQGGGSHVANCGYITSIASAGRGVARAMCTHSLEYGKTQGFLAMQFNFVVSTNDRAIRLWKSFGFETVGRLPKAFAHPLHGLIDALVMYRFL